MPRDNNAPSLHVSGFRDSTRPSELAEIFEPFGRILDVYIPKDYYTGAPRGFAYIQYENEEIAHRVYRSEEPFTLDGRDLRIQYAQGHRKSPHQMMRSGGRDRRRSRSRDRSNRSSSRRYSRSRSRSVDHRGHRRDSPSPVRRRYSRDSRSLSRSRSPRGRRDSRHSVSTKRRSSYSPRHRSYSPQRRRTPSPRERTPLRDDYSPR